MTALLKRAAQAPNPQSRGLESAWGQQNLVNQALPIFGTGVSYASAPIGAQTYSANAFIGGH